jgi:hypothetical protein
MTAMRGDVIGSLLRPPYLVGALDGFDRLGGWAIPLRDEEGEQLVFPRPVVVGTVH